MFAVIVENDVSSWKDQTGEVYHFPRAYKALLREGTLVIYYKGRIKDRSFSSTRLSDAPHYFGVAKVERVFLDSGSKKNDYFAVLGQFLRFETPVLAKVDGAYYERIPLSKLSNYWRSAVRSIDEDIYRSIIKAAESEEGVSVDKEFALGDTLLQSGVEGSKTSYMGERYERNPRLRIQAMAIHGVSCNACGFNFENFYGDYAKGLIHVHHVVPISQYDEERVVDPYKDMVTLCANCHAVVHRRKDITLSVEQLKVMIDSKKSMSD